MFLFEIVFGVVGLLLRLPRRLLLGLVLLVLGLLLIELVHPAPSKVANLATGSSVRAQSRSTPNGRELLRGRATRPQAAL